ncbi:MAG: MarR family transcriptional regulator [Rhodospirillales bacterium]|nr:MarR family transcriptional regulator [Rhodospirillales bacterium]
MKRRGTKRKAGTSLGLDYYAAPNESVGFMVREVYRSLARSLQARIAREGVSIGMWFVLRTLWEEDGLSQRELGDRIGLNAPTMVTALNAMERAGFVKRVPHATDRRKTNIFLTKRGHELKDVLWPMATEVLGLALKGISRDQIQVMARHLKRMLTNLDSDPRTTRSSPLS